MKNNVNDNKYQEYKKKKLLKYLIIILSLFVIVLEVLALFNVINMIWGLIVFVVLYFIKNWLLNDLKGRK